MKLRIRNLIIVLSVCAVAVITAGAALKYLFIKAKDPEERKAIIMLPGMMGSNLMGENNEGLWVLDGDTVGKLLSDPEATIDKMKGLMNINEDGSVGNYYRPANMRDGEKFMFTINGMLKLYYEYLTEEYPDWEIVCWQYDWRESNWLSAEKLEQFVNTRGYTQIVFMSHSMGGHVITKYMTKRENREKVKLFIPHGTPFFGSFDVYGFLFDSSNPPENDFFGKVLSLIDADKAVKNLYPIYELSPYSAFNLGPYFSGGSTFIRYGNNYLSVEGEIDLISSLPFAKMSDGTLKKQISAMLDYQNADFIIGSDGVRKHITDIVPTEFIAGMNAETIIGVDINLECKITNYRVTKEGDGTVPLYSATAGKSADAPNVHILNGITHNYLMERPEALEFIKKILPKYIG